MGEMTKPEYELPPLDNGVLDAILSSQVPAIVFVTTKDCYVCGPTKQELLRLAPKWSSRFGFFVVDADVDPRLAIRLDIRAVPAILVFFPGMHVQTLLGFRSMEELNTRLLNIIATADGG